MITTVIIGSGNVAEALARILPSRGLVVKQVLARNEERGRKVAKKGRGEWISDPAAIAEADLYIVAVSDSSIGEVLKPLALPENAIVVHTSGTQPVDVIPSRFARRGVLYPLQSFTSGRIVDFSQIPVLVEGSDPATVEFLLSVAERLTTRVMEVDYERRSKIHLAGVLVNNFTNAMFAAAKDIVYGMGLSFDLLAPIINETVAKAVESGDPRAMQTGPAVRNDRNTMERHLAMIDRGFGPAAGVDAAAEEISPELLAKERRERQLLGEIYEKISEYIYERKL